MCTCAAGTKYQPLVRLVYVGVKIGATYWSQMGGGHPWSRVPATGVSGGCSGQLYLSQTGCAWGGCVFSLANFKLDSTVRRQSLGPGQALWGGPCSYTQGGFANVGCMRDKHVSAAGLPASIEHGLVGELGTHKMHKRTWDPGKDARRTEGSCRY